MQSFLNLPLLLPDFSIESAKLAVESARNETRFPQFIPASPSSSCSSAGVTMKDDSLAAAASPADEEPNKVPLPRSFIPTIHHVVCGRGKRCYGHIGNQHFLTVVSHHIHAYEMAKSKHDKSEIVQRVVDEVEAKGGFVRLDAATGRYYPAVDQERREKTSQALRDFLKDKYKSSKDIKRVNRKQKRLAKSKQAIHTHKQFKDINIAFGEGEDTTEPPEDHVPSSSSACTVVSSTSSTSTSTSNSTSTSRSTSPLPNPVTSAQEPVPLVPLMPPRRVSDANFDLNQQGHTLASIVVECGLANADAYYADAYSTNVIVEDDMSDNNDDDNDELEELMFYPIDGFDELSQLGDLDALLF